METGRENHFNLLRIALAAGVLLSHCFPITQGSHDFAGEPWFDFTSGRHLLGVTCVLGFFIISGCLVSESFERAASLKDYFAARMLRIYPAAIGCMLLTVFLLGPLVSERPVQQYWATPGLTKFIVQTTTFLSLTLDEAIPGTFPENPVPGVMNGSLWTIPWELLCYLLLVPAGLVLYRPGRRWATMAGYCVLALLAALSAVQYALRPLSPGLLSGVVGFSGFFCIGILGRKAVARIPGSVLTMLCASLAFVGIARFEHDVPMIGLLSPFLLAYILLTAAIRLPRSWLAYNRLGDFSYGLYLYAWPVQQTITSVAPDIEPWTLFALALPATLAMAVPSWHLLEKRALKLKARFRASPQPLAATESVPA